MLAPILPRPIIAICICPPFPLFMLFPSCGTSLLFENVRELAVACGDSIDCVGTPDLFRAPGNEGVPEAGPANREADKAGNGSCRRQPFANLLIVFPAAQDDATH